MLLVTISSVIFFIVFAKNLFKDLGGEPEVIANLATQIAPALWCSARR